MKYMKIKVRGNHDGGYCHVKRGGIGSLDCFVLVDFVLWLDMRQSTRLFGSGGCFGCEDIFLEEALADKLFQTMFKIMMT